MSVLVTGARGQLGYDLVKHLLSKGVCVVATDLQHTENGILEYFDGTQVAYFSLDLTDESAVYTSVTNLRPDVVIHCAAWTAVDDAEKLENRDSVRRINEDATKFLAAACRDAGCKMVYISTDYVFSGRGNLAWDPDSQDFEPLNVYGMTKLSGELAVRSQLESWFIVRIAWVFGSNGKNFVRTMLNVGRKYETVRVVNDQIGTPTYTADLAVFLGELIKSDQYGIYHVTNEGGYISWYDFACEIFRQAGLKTRVIPVSTEKYGISLAKRPCNSRLDKSKLVRMGFCPLPDWTDALHRYLKECGEI